MSTIREQIMLAVMVIAQAVPGMAAASVTRERDRAVQEGECPALDVEPDNEPAPQALGTGGDKRALSLRFTINTVGAGASALADPIVKALHSGLYLDPTLGGLAATIIPGETEFSREAAGRTIGRTTLIYTVVYTTSRSDLSAKARS